MKDYIELSNSISWKNKDFVQDILSKNKNLDLLYRDGKFFNMAIENDCIDIIVSLVRYFDNYQLAKYTSNSTEYLLLKNKLRSVLEAAIEDIELSQGMKEALSPYISFEGSEHNDSFLEDEYIGSNFIFKNQTKFPIIKKFCGIDDLNNNTQDDSKENLLTEEDLKKVSNNSSAEKLHLIEEFLDHLSTYDMKDLAGDLNNTDEL